MKTLETGNLQLLGELDLRNIPFSELEAVQLFERSDSTDDIDPSDVGTFNPPEAMSILERYWIRKDSYGGRGKGEPITIGIIAWTKKRIFFTHDYDGQISVRSVPRNPES